MFAQKFLVAAILALFAFLALVECKPTTEIPSVMCKLPEVRGHCRALLPRWRYDPASGKCTRFNFGGCDGNGNNFESQKACMKVCKGV